MRSPRLSAMGPLTAAGWRSSASSAVTHGAGKVPTRFPDFSKDEALNDNRNLMVWLVLSALVLLGWSLLSDKLLPTAGPQTQQVHNGKVVATPQPQASPAALPAKPQDRTAVLGSTPR